MELFVIDGQVSYLSIIPSILKFYFSVYKKTEADFRRPLTPSTPDPWKSGISPLGIIDKYKYLQSLIIDQWTIKA